MTEKTPQASNLWATVRTRPWAALGAQRTWAAWGAQRTPQVHQKHLQAVREELSAFWGEHRLEEPVWLTGYPQAELAEALGATVSSLLERFQETAQAKLMEQRIRRLEKGLMEVADLQARLTLVERSVALDRNSLSSPTASALVEPEGLLDQVGSIAAEVAPGAFHDLAWTEDSHAATEGLSAALLTLKFDGLSREQLRVVRTTILERVHEQLPAEWFAQVTIKVDHVDES